MLLPPPQHPPIVWSISPWYVTPRARFLLMQAPLPAHHPWQECLHPKEQRVSLRPSWWHQWQSHNKLMVTINTVNALFISSFLYNELTSPLLPCLHLTHLTSLTHLSNTCKVFRWLLPNKPPTKMDTRVPWLKCWAPYLPTSSSHPWSPPRVVYVRCWPLV